MSDIFKACRRCSRYAAAFAEVGDTVEIVKIEECQFGSHEEVVKKVLGRRPGS